MKQLVPPLPLRLLSRTHTHTHARTLAPGGGAGSRLRGEAKGGRGRGHLIRATGKEKQLQPSYSSSRGRCSQLGSGRGRRGCGAAGASSPRKCDSLQPSVMTVQERERGFLPFHRLCRRCPHLRSGGPGTLETKRGEASSAGPPGLWPRCRHLRLPGQGWRDDMLICLYTSKSISNPTSFLPAFSRVIPETFVIASGT